MKVFFFHIKVFAILMFKVSAQDKDFPSIDSVSQTYFSVGTR